MYPKNNRNTLSRLDSSAIAPSADSIPGIDYRNWQKMDEELRQIQWAWDAWLPKGYLTVLAGESGVGKSALALRICSVFLRGDPWPDGRPYTGETGAVLWCETDGAQVVNLTRARAWGLPLDQIRSPLPNPSHDLCLEQPAHRAALVEKALWPQVKLIVIDSLTDDENTGNTLSLMEWLVETARLTRKPVILTHSLDSQTMLDVLDHFYGYSPIIRTAPVVWALDIPDPDQLEAKRLQVIKSRLGAHPAPLRLKIEQKGYPTFTAGRTPQPSSGQAVR